MLNILCIAIEEPLLEWVPSEEQNGFPQYHDHSFGGSIVWTGFL